MAYNHAGEEKKFKEEWKRKETEYRKFGMTEEQIQEIYKFERETFNSDRRYYENTVELKGENTYGTQGNSIIPTDLRENWTEFIEDEEKYKRVMECSAIMRKAYFMNKIAGYTIIEISSELSIPKSTLGDWIVKIAEILG